MSNAPQIDVYIPVYNGEDVILRAIQSCLDQVAVDVRVIVSDNLSSDRTPEIVSELAQNDPRVVLMQNPKNIGMLPNINRLFDVVERPFYMFLCADDHLIDQNAFSKALALLDAHPEMASVYSDMQFQDGAGQRILDNRFKRSSVFDPKSVFIQSLVRTRNGFGIPLLHRSQDGLSYQYQSDCVYASDVLQSYMCARGKTCGHIPELCIGNTYAGGNMTRGMMQTALKAFRQAEVHANISLSPSQRLRQSINHRLVFIQKIIFFQILLPIRRLLQSKVL